MTATQRRYAAGSVEHQVLTLLDGLTLRHATTGYLASQGLANLQALRTLVSAGHLTHGVVGRDDPREVYTLTHAGRAAAGREVAELGHAVDVAEELASVVAEMSGQRAGATPPPESFWRYQYLVELVASLARSVADAAHLAGYIDVQDPTSARPYDRTTQAHPVSVLAEDLLRGAAPPNHP